jgi:hypothetical protein
MTGETIATALNRGIDERIRRRGNQDEHVGSPQRIACGLNFTTFSTLVLLETDLTEWKKYAFLTAFVSDQFIEPLAELGAI